MKRTHNAGQKDCAQMWFGPDFRGSLKVQAMTWAEQGMYRHLLDLAWENQGLPSDLEEIRGILRLSPQEFAAAWKRIGKCFAPHPDDPERLVNERQEKERGIRASIKQKRLEAGQRGNEVLRAERERIANADANGNTNGAHAGTQSGRLSPSPPPSPSQVPLRPSGPGQDAPRPSGGPTQDDSPSAQDQAGSSGTPAGDSDAAKLLEALRATSYRVNSRNRSEHLLKAVARLDAAGITPTDLLKLAQRAMRKGKKPHGLFATWIDNIPEALKEIGKR